MPHMTIAPLWFDPADDTRIAVPAAPAGLRRVGLGADGLETGVVARQSTACSRRLARWAVASTSPRPRAVPFSVIEQCLALAPQAPTAGSGEGWHFVVVTD